jgi:hypothetical protein
MTGPTTPTATFNRSLISDLDFDQAVDFLYELRHGENLSDTVQEALLMAAVISYARPFTSNKSPHGEASRTLTPEAREQLTPEEQQLHEHLMSLRNELLAHSDFRRRRVSNVVHHDTGFMVSAQCQSILHSGIDRELMARVCQKLKYFCRVHMADIAEQTRPTGSAEQPNPTSDPVIKP